MPRGYWRVIVAAIGCLIGALLLTWMLQPEKPHLRGDGGYEAVATEYQAGGAGCQPSILDRLPVRKRQSKTDSCRETAEQHREAADSLIEARRQADAANAGTILVFEQTRVSAWSAAIGLLTLLAAVAAAIFAERAAHHTDRGANAAEAQLRISSDTAKKQLRAYLDIAAIEWEDFPAREGGYAGPYGFAITLKNYGATPANAIARTVRYVFNDPAGPQRDIWEHQDRPGNVAPGDTGTMHDEVPLENLHWQAVAEAYASVIIVIEMTYCDVFGDVHRLFGEFETDGRDPILLRQGTKQGD